MAMSLSSKPVLADWAVEVALGMTRGTCWAWQWWRMPLRAEVSPLAFSVVISTSLPEAFSLATMVSRIWSREVWLMGWTMATLYTSPPQVEVPNPEPASEPELAGALELPQPARAAVSIRAESITESSFFMRNSSL